MTFHIITIFPHIFDSYFNESILKRAQDEGHIKIKIHNLRDYTEDKHKTVDDSPFGGGAGMVMKIEPIYKAIQNIRKQDARYKTQDTNKLKIQNSKKIYSTLGIRHSKIVLLSAKGKTWDQQLAKGYTKHKNIILICGRYEGVDERVTEFIDEEISIGDYVLTGGEIPAMIIVDSITRLLPGVLGNKESAIDESHSTPGILEYPQYTRPEVFTDNNDKKHTVPPVLLSGNHKEIEEWRKEHSNKLNKK